MVLYAVAGVVLVCPFIGFSFVIYSYICHLIWLLEEIEHIILAVLALVIILLLWPSMEAGMNSWAVVALCLSCMFFSLTSPLLVYVTFEIGLIPVAVIILAWGVQPERISALYHLLVYTICFSAPLFFAILLSEHISCLTPSFLVSALFSIALMANTPLYFLHVWLPNAHVEAATSGSIILAGILLNTGGVGFIWLLNLVSIPWNLVFFLFTCLGIVFATVSCAFQSDIKAFVAYSSVAHINYSTLVVILNSLVSDSNSSLLMLAHGLASSAILMLAGSIFHFVHSRIMYFARTVFMFNELAFSVFALVIASNLSFPPAFPLFGEVFSFSGLMLMFWGAISLGGLYFIFVAYYSLYLLLSGVGVEGNFDHPSSHLSLYYMTAFALLNLVFLSFY